MWKQTKNKRSARSAVMDFLCLGTVCVVYLSGIRLPQSAFLMINAAGMLLLPIVAKGKLTVNKTNVLWLLGLLLIVLRTNISHSSAVIYDLVYLIGVLSVCFSFKQNFNIAKAKRILFYCSLLHIALVTAESLIKEPFLSVIRPVLSDALYEEQLRLIRLGKGLSGFAISSNITTYAGIYVILFSLYDSDSKNFILNSKILKAAAVLLSFAMFIITGGRSSIVIAALCIALIYVLQGDRKSKPFKYLLLALLALFLLFIFQYLEPLLEKNITFSRIIDAVRALEAGESVDETRSLLYSTAIGMWKRSPVWGNGWYSFFTENSGIIRTGASHAHNMLSELLADLGLVGCILIYLPFLTLLIQMIRSVKPRKAGRLQESNKAYLKYIGFQLFFILDSLMHVGFYSKEIILFYFLVILFGENETARYGKSHCRKAL